MIFKEKTISHERCEEINKMKIVCPWSTEVFKMDEEGTSYLTNEDESIIYGWAFVPKPLDLSSNSDIDFDDYFFLVVGNEYFLHALDTIDSHEEIIDGVLHEYETVELPNDEKINNREDKDHILDLINFLNFYQFDHDERSVSKQTLIYNGKEYTSEGIGEFIES